MLPFSFVRVPMKYHSKCESNTLKMIFPKKWTFLHNCPLDMYKAVLMILPKDFCLISITLHIFKFVQKIFPFKKFLRKRRMHFWLACWKSCCQKLHYVIAQNPELIIKVWLFQKMLCIKIFCWTPWIQHWKPCWKRFTKSLTCFLLKLGEWW